MPFLPEETCEMISICIPVYNYLVSGLVESLESQLIKLDAPAEIVVIDDGSAQEYRLPNRSTCEGHTYIELEENVGRARIRNLFSAHARYDHLLFLDCDSRITEPGFLSAYARAIELGSDAVICGGRTYPSERPARDRILRWKVGIERESRPAAARKLQPARSFMTNNFVVNRAVLEKVRFDDRLTGYGHEDTLFGYRLMKEGIPVGHIGNPVLNGELEMNGEFLKKTAEGARNLALILDFIEEPEGFIREVTLLRYHAMLKRRGLDRWVYALYVLTAPLVRSALAAGLASLQLFDFYKMGVLIRSLRERG